MERSRADLARAIDGLAAAGRAAVTESRTELALYQLGGADAREVLMRLAPAGFKLARLADEGGDVRPDALKDDQAGLELVAKKPAAPENVFPVLTATGFGRLLVRAPTEAIVWVRGLDRLVETMTVLYAPWDTEVDFAAQEAPADPSRVVRFLGDRQPQQIGHWLLRNPDTDLSGPILSQWRALASEVLARALAQEIERDSRLLFRGPPPTRFRDEGAKRVEIPALAALQRGVAWVYENDRELENRHGLLGAEIARTALRDGDLADLCSVMTTALEGARIAYGFGVSQQSRDALKALSDLRKAVSDETAKLADSTRTLAGAVMAATVGNLSLLVARLTVAKSATFIGWAAAAIGLALTLYVGAVIATGCHFLTIQRDLRRDWRERLYRFLGNDEYELMVTTPVRKAEAGFIGAAWVSGIVAALLFGAMLLVMAVAS